MNLPRISGLVLIAGFALVWIGAFVAPPGAYEGSDIDRRLEVVANNQSSWIVSKVFDGLAVVVPAIGFILLTMSLRGSQNPLPPTLGASAYGVAAIFGVIYVYFLAVDPGAIWRSSSPPLVAVAFFGILLVALFLYGIAFLQGGFPKWLSYLTIGAAIVGLVFFLLFVTASPFGVNAFSYGFGVGALASAVILVVGLVLVRQSRTSTLPSS